jgi:mevalonate kinase
MARGNQREKAREANQKKMAAQVRLSGKDTYIATLGMSLFFSTQRQELQVTDTASNWVEIRELKERNRAAARQGASSREDEGEATARYDKSHLAPERICLPILTLL